MRTVLFGLVTLQHRNRQWMELDWPELVATSTILAFGSSKTPTV